MSPSGRRPRGWLAALLLLLAHGPTAASPWTLDSGRLEPHEIAGSQALLDAAFARMPPAWRTTRPAIEFAWSDTLPDDVHGRARGDHVLLRRSLLDAWLASPADPSASGPARRAAIATVLHEAAHVHDRRGAGWSRDPRLLDLAGWQLRPLTPGVRTRTNAFSDRSPDHHELKSPAEFIAVNIEHFLLDPEYACRRPALHRHLADRLGWAPVSSMCPPGMAFVVAPADASDGTAELVDLYPARIHAVDYLLADGDGPPLSRWGHSMLRLVVCAPGRDNGPDCRLDLQHHLVLSFRAFVDDVQASSWRGLTGGYPSRLYVLPLDQVIDEYTKVELRGLRSIPLRLGAAEIGGLLERAAQLHWSYDGRYRFIANNCATETWRLLHEGVPRLAAADVSSITPNGLLRRMRRAGIADTRVLDDHAAALRLGHRFESASAQFDAMFVIADRELALPSSDAEGWMRLPPDGRAPWLGRGSARASAALLLLEQAALRREQAAARDELKRGFLQLRQASNGAVAVARGEGVASTLAAMHAEAARLARPASLLDGAPGYGLPQAEERAWASRSGAERGASLQRFDALLRLRTTGWVTPGRRTTIDRIQRNLVAIGERLRVAGT